MSAKAKRRTEGRKRRKTGKMPPGLRRYWERKNAALTGRKTSGKVKKMAKRKQPAALAAYQAGLRSGVHRHPGAQTIVVRPVAAHPTKHHKGKRHHRVGATSEKALMALVIGGFVVGYLDKPGGLGDRLPTIPLLGKAGTIALGAHFFGKGRPGMVTDVRNAAAAIAGYEFGFKGSISGVDTQL